MMTPSQTVLVASLVLALSAPPAAALDQEQIGREPTGAEMLVDATLARPIGLAATVLGAVTWVVALPFTLPSGSATVAAKQLVSNPAQFTFKRPLGQLDSCDALPDSCK